MSQIPEVGKPLPPFSLPAVQRIEGELVTSTRSNADFLGKPFVLFFYPKDDTPGCTVEVCGFRDLHPEFQALGVEIVGVSRDGVGPHKKFIEAQNLPYMLLADKEQEVIKGWELLVHKTMYGKPVTGVSRNTFVVDAGGKVQRIFEKVTPLGHAQEVLDYVRSL
ncbi:MAG TPA: peroxiredoxin [Abditibacteriaceae bacterium]|jgi:peroxiredoxin Q/BCP